MSRSGLKGPAVVAEERNGSSRSGRPYVEWKIWAARGSGRPCRRDVERPDLAGGTWSGGLEVGLGGRRVGV